MRLAIIGSRSFNNYDLFEKTIFKNYKIENIKEIISGGVEGTDSLAEQFAIKYSIPMSIFIPDWDLYGEYGEYGDYAVYMRNILIIDSSDEVIAFWDGISKGTKHSIELANKAKKKLMIVKV